jgi:hypothetical protein
MAVLRAGLPGNLGRSPRTWVKPRTGVADVPTAPYERSDAFSNPALKPLGLTEGQGTRLTVVDLGLGRVALRSTKGLVSVGRDGQLSLNHGTASAPETFQWIETFTGELILLSLATDRYVRLDGETGALRADSRGPHPNGRDGVRWVWQPRPRSARLQAGPAP